MRGRIDKVTGMAEAFAKCGEFGCAFLMLGHGKYTLVDRSDVEALVKLNWRISTSGYATTRINRKTTYLHRLLAGDREGMEVDHTNRDKLDNRRCNLRFCTASQNLANCGPRSHNKASAFKGVRKNKSGTRYTARGTAGGIQRWLGSFVTEIEAAIAYNKWAVSQFGEFAGLNKIQ